MRAWGALENIRDTIFVMFSLLLFAPTLAHRHNLIRGHKTGPNNSGVEEKEQIREKKFQLGIRHLFVGVAATSRY